MSGFPAQLSGSVANANSFHSLQLGRTLRKRSPGAREHMDVLEDDEKEAMNATAKTASG